MTITVSRTQRGLLALCSLSLAAGLAMAQAPAKPAPKPAPAKAPAAKVAAPEGYSVAPAPAWVAPQSPDPSITLPAAPVQVLLMDHQTRVDPAGTWRYQHAVRQITDSAGLQQGSQIQVDFDPSYQRLVFHRLEIWREGKRIDKLADRKLVKLLHREPNLERQMVDGRMTASVVLDDLRVGDRIEWAASLVGDNPVFDGKFVDQEWTSSSLGPVGLVNMRLLAPAAREIRHQERTALGIEVAQQTTKDGWRETTFRRRAVAQFHYDPLLPPGEMLADQIEFSEFADWADVAAWAQRLFAKAGVSAGASSDALAAQAEAIRAKAQAAGRDTPEERLRLALDFVQRDIRYFGTEMGANSHQPATADTVLKQRFGDCKDKAALLVNLLKQLDIEAAPVLVSAYSRDAVQGRLPSPLAFDHAIATVTLPGTDAPLWLDGTRGQQSGAPQTRQSYGLGRGLIARSGVTALSTMPPAREALRSETTATLRFPRLAEEGTFESVTVYHGEMAEWLRAARDSMPAEELQKALIGEISRAWPSFSQQGQALIEEVDGSNALKVTLRFGTGANYWRFPDKRTLVGDFILLDLIVPLRLPNQTPRTEAMQIGGSGRYLYKLRFEFGEDAFAPPSAANATGRFDEANDWFALHLRYASAARSQQVDGELALNADEIAAGKWSAYRDKLTKVLPRLGSALTVPALAPAQVAGLRKSLDELGDSIKRGTVKVTTAEQVSVRTKLLIADRELEANRLPPKPRAQVLQERGIQLDLLGLPDGGKLAFEDALKLDPDNAEIHGALAANALMRRQDAEAVEHADRALALAPSDTGPRYTRVWANYFGNQLPAARDELKDILQTSPAEVERSYGGIWLYLVSRRLGDEAGAQAVQSPSDSQPAWPYAVLQLMQGRLDLDGALVAAREDAKARPGRECELYFYAAQKALADQDLAKARGYLRKSLDTGVVEFNEYSMAKRELERIGAR